MKILEVRNGTGPYLGMTIYLETEFTAIDAQDFKKQVRAEPDKFPAGDYIPLTEKSKPIHIEKSMQTKIL